MVKRSISAEVKDLTIDDQLYNSRSNDRVCTSVKKYARDVPVFPLRCAIERRRGHGEYVRDRIHIRPCSQKNAHGLNVPFSGREVQCAKPIAGPRVDIHSTL